MGSKGRIPPHLRHPLAGPGQGHLHPDPFAPGIRPPHGSFPHFDMLPPPEIMEQKLAAQHVEMQKLAAENQRLAATQGTLRHELAASQHELQMLCAHVGSAKSEKEHQMRGLMEKIAKMESELRSAEPIKRDLQQARAEAQGLHTARQELVTKAQQLGQDLQMSHSDMQQIPALMSELETLRQEYQQCRATYDYEKKLYDDHLESLQVMEKNYMSMATEVEKLRSELTNSANVDKRTGGAYGATTGYSENEAKATGHFPVGQNAYDDGYGVPQGRGPLPSGAGGVTHVGPQSGPAPARTGYDASSYDPQRGTGGAIYDAPRGPTGPGYDPHRGPGGPIYERGPGYDSQRGPTYDAQRGPVYDARGPDAQRGPIYDTRGGPGYDVQRGHSFDTPKGGGYDASSRGPQGHAVPTSNVAPYGSATPPTRAAGAGYDAQAQGRGGGNHARRLV